MKTNILIIGAGASGLMCASFIAYRLKSMGITSMPEITLLESSERIGRKILATGNGRCNLTNTVLSSDNYYCDDTEKLTSIINKYSNSFVTKFFSDVLGVTTTDINGWVYPKTLRSNTILDSMRMYLDEAGVRIVTSCRVTGITKNDSFNISTTQGDYTSDIVISAVGGASYPNLGTDGTSYQLGSVGVEDIIKPCPALVPLKCADEDIKKLSGIRLPVELFLNVDDICEKGEILFTDYGISGICVMQLSGFCNSYVLANGKYPRLSIDFLPDYETSDIVDRINKCISLFPNRSIANCLSGFIRTEITSLVVKRLGIKAIVAGELKNSEIIKLAKMFKSLEVRINGSEGFDHSQVTRGGIKLGKLSDKLQYSNGIYYVGEVVNVDGKCGGYNLQWAWSSAMLVADEISSKYE